MNTIMALLEPGTAVMTASGRNPFVTSTIARRCVTESDEDESKPLLILFDFRTGSVLQQPRYADSHSRGVPQLSPAELLEIKRFGFSSTRNVIDSPSRESRFFELGHGTVRYEPDCFTGNDSKVVLQHEGGSETELRFIKVANTYPRPPRIKLTRDPGPATGIFEDGYSCRYSSIQQINMGTRSSQMTQYLGGFNRLEYEITGDGKVANGRFVIDNSELTTCPGSTIPLEGSLSSDGELVTLRGEGPRGCARGAQDTTYLFESRPIIAAKYFVDLAKCS